MFNFIKHSELQMKMPCMWVCLVVGSIFSNTKVNRSCYATELVSGQYYDLVFDTASLFGMEIQFYRWNCQPTYCMNNILQSWPVLMVFFNTIAIYHTLGYFYRLNLYKDTLHNKAFTLTW